ncbi:MAG: hypothetical protein ABR600_01265 [Actinomycetota bacterium]
MIRRIGVGFIVASVVIFVIAFFHTVIGNVPSSCSGSECLHGESKWVLILPGSVFGFVAGVLMVSFGGRGYGRTNGPKSFGDVDSGAWSPNAVQAREAARPPRTLRWTRTWRNVYGYVGFGELGLGLLFIIAGIVKPEARGGGFFTGGLLGAIGIVFLVVGWRAAQKDRLHDTGIEGEATIASIHQTGMLMNNNPYVKLGLVIKTPGHQPYEVEHGEIVPLTLLGRLTNGETLPVKVDPNRPSHFVIQWERA